MTFLESSGRCGAARETCGREGGGGRRGGGGTAIEATGRDADWVGAALGTGRAEGSGAGEAAGAPAVVVTVMIWDSEVVAPGISPVNVIDTAKNSTSKRCRKMETP